MFFIYCFGCGTGGSFWKYTAVLSDDFQNMDVLIKTLFFCYIIHSIFNLYVHF